MQHQRLLSLLQGALHAGDAAAMQRRLAALRALGEGALADGLARLLAESELDYPGPLRQLRELEAEAVQLRAANVLLRAELQALHGSAGVWRNKRAARRADAAAGVNAAGATPAAATGDALAAGATAAAAAGATATAAAGD